jgi:hypothetical protein
MLVLGLFCNGRLGYYFLLGSARDSRKDPEILMVPARKNENKEPILAYGWSKGGERLLKKQGLEPGPDRSSCCSSRCRWLSLVVGAKFPGT